MAELLPADAASIVRAAALLRQGRLVAFPTETVYGLGANALDAEAVARIFEAKGRPSTNPLIVHVAGAEEALRVVAEWPEMARLLAERFWPGPLTLVLPRAAGVPDIVTAGGPTVAVRVPAHPVALALLREAAVPLAAPSANRSGQLSPTRAEHVMEGLGERIEAVLDGGPTTGGIESTVLGLVGAARLLRPGLVSVAEIEAVIGPIERGPAASGILQSPGLLERHYAPRTPLTVSEDAAGLCRRLLAEGVAVGLLTHAEGVEGVVVERLPATPAGYAAGLYDALHRLDRMGLARVVVAAVPDGEEWLAVRDRLRRAAAAD
jgi:L-threonylcarbamoyladenylate synthase